MSAELRLDGLDDLRQTLATLAHDVKVRELGPEVRTHAEQMADDVRGAYPKHTGTLAARVIVEPGSDPDLRMKVRTKAPHAHLYEYGTIQRFTKGSGANRGTMPAKPIFEPAAVRWRARMVQAVKQRLQTLRVPGLSGSPEVRES